MRQTSLGVVVHLLAGGLVSYAPNRPRRQHPSKRLVAVVRGVGLRRSPVGVASHYLWHSQRRRPSKSLEFGGVTDDVSGVAISVESGSLGLQVKPVQLSGHDLAISRDSESRLTADVEDLSIRSTVFQRENVCASHVSDPNVISQLLSILECYWSLTVQRTKREYPANPRVRVAGALPGALNDRVSETSRGHAVPLSQVKCNHFLRHFAEGILVMRPDG